MENLVDSRDQTLEKVQNALLLLQAFEKSSEILETLYPELSAEKLDALYFIKKRYSYRETAFRLKRNHTIITQWSKNDPKFKKALDEIKMERHKSIRIHEMLRQAGYEEKTSTSENVEEIKDSST